MNDVSILLLTKLDQGTWLIPDLRIHYFLSMESYNLVNANIITLNASLQIANTITISNGKIENINQPNNLYKTLDLNGHTVIPGFIDAHFHLKNFGKRLEMLNLKGIKSLDEIRTIIPRVENKIKTGISNLFSFRSSKKLIDIEILAMHPIIIKILKKVIKSEDLKK